MSPSAELPFVVAPPGDVTRATAVAAIAAEHWDLPEPHLMRAGMSALFTAGDDVVLRVCRPTATPSASIELAARLTDAGLRVPRFVRDDVVVTDDGLAAYAVAREHPAGDIDWATVGSMVARLHDLDPAVTAGSHPAPPCHTFPWWDLDGLLADVADDLDRGALDALAAAIERHRGWRTWCLDTVLCHGDVHPGNVIATEAGPVLIDWDLLCTGPRAWDHGPLMTWSERWGGQHGIYERFADGYGRSLRGDRVGEAIAELRLVAATLMRVHAGRVDPSAAAEAERRLAWWRGDPSAPQWRAM